MISKKPNKLKTGLTFVHPLIDRSEGGHKLVRIATSQKLIRSKFPRSQPPDVPASYNFEPLFRRIDSQIWRCSPNCGVGWVGLVALKRGFISELKLNFSERF